MPNPDDTKQADLRGHFEQANASLALEGLSLDADQLAVQERVIAGELTYDRAVVQLAELAKQG